MVQEYEVFTIEDIKRNEVKKIVKKIKDSIEGEQVGHALLAVSFVLGDVYMQCEDMELKEFLKTLNGMISAARETLENVRKN